MAESSDLDGLRRISGASVGAHRSLRVCSQRNFSRVPV